MKKIIDFILLIKKELVICITVPILTAILLDTNKMPVPFLIIHYPLITMGLFCAFMYGIIKMIIKVTKGDAALSEADVNKQKSTKYRIFTFIAAVVMPVCGLMLNMHWGGVFGDFSNIWFYIIAILNGLIMLMDINGDRLGVMLFYLKIVGFTYITYFAAIFIPFLTYGFMGLIFYGLGILVFVPATVFFIEIFQILQDMRRLIENFKIGAAVAIILGILTIPTVMAVNFSIDRINFNKALTYLSADSYEMPTINIARLKRALSVLITRQANRDVIIGGKDIPVISRFYQVVALNDRILSLDTTRRLSRIFLGAVDNQSFNDDTGRSQNVWLIDAGTDSEFDEKAGMYKTWVDLEVKNESNRQLAEYRTEFLLPDGCFISDYYLYVNNERKQGILTDKRAALITYENIIRTPRDPGIIYYKNDSMIELRVYPFSAGEIRKTGFLVWHSQNETITIDGREIYLAAEKSITEPIEMQGICFIPAVVKKSLPTRERTPKYYFVIDASENSPYDEHLKKITDYVNYHKIMNAEIYAASYKLYNTNKSGVKREGGFNLPLAMEIIFKEAEGRDILPIIIAVSDNINKAPLFLKSSIAKRFPESEQYYNLGYDLFLTPYSFSENKKYDTVKAPILKKALGYNNLIVADNDKSETVISGQIGDYTDNEYQNAFILHGKSSVHGSVQTQIELVRDSFRKRILTKYTAFTVLETREQENALLELQAKFLNNDGKDAPAVMMDEPSLLLCLFMFFAFALLLRRRRRRRGMYDPVGR